MHLNKFWNCIFTGLYHIFNENFYIFNESMPNLHIWNKWQWQSCCLWQGFILIKVKKQSLSQVVHPLIRPCDTCSSSCSAYFCLLNSFSVPSRSSLSLCASCLAVTISFRITRSRLTFSSATVWCSSCAICSLNINTLSISKWTTMDLLLNQPVNVVSLSHQQVARCRNE